MLLQLGGGSGIKQEKKVLVICLGGSNPHIIQIFAHFYILTSWIKDQQTLPVKGHIVNILGFAGQMVSVAATQLCSGGVKAAICSDL